MIEQTLTHPWNLPPIPQTGTSWKNLMAVLPPCGWQKPYPLTKPLISRNLRRSHSNHISKSSTAELPILSMPVCFTKFQPVFRRFDLERIRSEERRVGKECRSR